jgi:uncharacterized phage protein (TIGR01671 family)
MIKIRMWDKHANAMSYGQACIFLMLAEQAVFNNPDELFNVGDDIQAIDHSRNFVFMPYTGVDDQTGKHIYAGDYVRIIWPHWQLCFVVKQERGAFVLHNPQLPNMQQFPALSNYMQVVGNIFETPDLQLTTAFN